MSRETGPTSGVPPTPQREAEPAVFKVRIAELRSVGARVEIPGRGKAWLPAHELFPDLKPHDFPKRASELLGKEIEVIEFEAAIGSAERLVSHIRVRDDPWRKVETWGDGEVKVMEVVARTSTRVIGIIDRGVRALVPLATMEPPRACSFLPSSWDSFDIPLPGDEVAGYFRASQVNHADRIVQLDYVAYVKNGVKIADALTTAKSTLTDGQLAGRTTTNTPTVRLFRGLIDRAMIVDDEEIFLKSLSLFLRKLGCEVSDCASETQARELLSGPHDEFDVAIVDVHLTGSGDYSGLSIASLLAAQDPRCHIVLVSGELLDVHAPAVLPYADLRVSGFVAKPFGVDELYSVLAVGAGARNRPLKQILSPRGEKADSCASVRATYSEELRRTCGSLASELMAEVVLFRINPVTWVVDVVAQSDPAITFDKVAAYKLDRSPVRDVAMDGEEVVTGHANGEARKHFWLLKAHPYESCIGVPVLIHTGTPFAHALFAFHLESDHFDDSDHWRVQLTAKVIGHILKNQALEEEVRQMKPFELMGKGYGSMAHDLSSAIPDEFLFNALSQAIGEGNYPKAAEWAAAARRQSERAKGIVQTFRAMARGQHDSDSRFSLEEVVSQAVLTFEAQARAVGATCRMAPYDGDPCTVQMRRSGLDQVLFNLLLNAAQQIDRLQPLRQGSGEILVEMQIEPDPNGSRWALVLVRDNGPGIHRRDFDRVFDMHYTTKKDGCGMGLSICREIADHVRVGDRKGSLRVRRSVLLAGTTFELRLPL